MQDIGTKQKGSYLPKNIHVRANILVNLRPTVGIQVISIYTIQQ